MNAFIRGDNAFFVAYTMFCCTKDPSYFCNTNEYYSTLTYDNTTDLTQQYSGVEPVVVDTLNNYSSPPPSLLPPRSLSTSVSASVSQDVRPLRCVRCRLFLGEADTFDGWCEECHMVNMEAFCVRCEVMLHDDARFCHCCGAETPKSTASAAVDEEWTISSKNHSFGGT